MNNVHLDNSHVRLGLHPSLKELRTLNRCIDMKTTKEKTTITKTTISKVILEEKKILSSKENSRDSPIEKKR